jgi:hypothetical protein
VPAHDAILGPTLKQWNQVRDAFDIRLTLGDMDAVLRKDYQQMDDLCLRLGAPLPWHAKVKHLVSRIQS